jgi:hypothetical protein
VPGKRSGPPIRLVTLDRSARLLVAIDHLPTAEQEEIMALVPYVGGVKALFARQWPAAGVHQGRPGHYTRGFPFADCWPLHSELVLEFMSSRRWTADLESGGLAPGAFGGEYDRWMRHLREVTVAMVREVSQLCMASGAIQHIDPSVPRQSIVSSTPSRPPLPGVPVLRAAAGPAFATGWTDHVAPKSPVPAQLVEL